MGPGYQSQRERVLLHNGPDRLFERTRELLGMQKTLVNFFKHPEEMHELIDIIADWEVDWIREFCSQVESELMSTTTTRGPS